MSNVSLSGSSGEQTEFQHRITELPASLGDRIWNWLTERAGPIVVKEVRQSLKSKQFTISFGLTLLASVVWTVLAVSLTVPRIYYIPGGMTLLVGFLCIMIVPLMIIIPASAIRSLIAETEDSTYELLSISALSASQIVYGKMISACLQIVLYVSALAPCILLTYLLRGVSLFEVLFFLGLTITFSICETAIALLLGAISQTRVLQIFVTLCALGGLMVGAIAWASLIVSSIEQFTNPPVEIFIVLFALGICLAFAISLTLRAAAAALDFPSENNSTPLRWRLLLFVYVCTFWVMLGFSASPMLEPIVTFLIFIFILLGAVGGIMTGELGIMSPRAQRSLPVTFFGRMTLSWFYPGAGLGYVFVVLLFASIFVAFSAEEIYLGSEIRATGMRSVLANGYLMLMYLVFYVGINRLIMLLIPRAMPARMIAAFALLVVLALMFHLIPLIIVFYLNDYREFPYAVHQAFNVPFTLITLNDVGFTSELWQTAILLTAVGGVVFFLNLLTAGRDILLVRVALPKRVLEEENEVTDVVETIDPFAD